MRDLIRKIHFKILLAVPLFVQGLDNLVIHAMLSYREKALTMIS